MYAVCQCPRCETYALLRVERLRGGWVIHCTACGPVYGVPDRVPSPPLALPLARRPRRKHGPLRPPRRSGRPRKEQPLWKTN